jgi:ATP synthase protein I
MAIERTRVPSTARWGDEEDGSADRAFEPLTREQAQALREREPPLSPWRIVGVQAVVGVLAALLAALVGEGPAAGWSALYGAAAVVLPGALLARGMSSRLLGESAQGRAVSFVLWQTAKIGLAVSMLAMAPWLVRPLSWPALLVGLVLCLKVYWVALLWRAR